MGLICERSGPCKDFFLADRSPYRQCTCWADKTYLRIPEYEHIVWKTTMFFGPLFKYRTSYRQPINEGIRYTS